MKKLLFSLIVLAVAGVVNAQPPKGPVTPGTTFGAATNTKGAVAIATLPETLAKTATVDTKVKAKVLEVCPKKGCWMKLQVNDTTTAFVKMKDYGFFVPLEMVGKTIVLDGEASLKTTSVEELRHYAEDAKKSKEEIAAITKPQQEIKLTAKGIVIVD